MSFLAPLFLLGAAAIAAPVLFHLIRRTTRERMPFSSVMFLQPSPPRLSRRHRFEHVLLLLLRCTILVLLALGFARPFFTSPATPGDPASAAVRRVILIDVSASMRRDGVWPAARAAVEAQLRRTAPGDSVALLAFDRAVTTVLSFDEWRQLPASDRVAAAAARMASVAPGWGTTHLGHALTTAADNLAEPEAGAPRGRREIVLVSDVQEGSRLDDLQGYDWPKDLRLVVVPVVARHVTNAGLQVAGEPVDAPSTRTTRVRVANAAGSKREQFQIGWMSSAGTLVSPIDAYVPAGQSRAFSLPMPSATTSGPARIGLTGDDEPFDNTVYVEPPAQQTTSVLWLGTGAAKTGATDDTRSPLVFLRRAYTDTPRLAVRLNASSAERPVTPEEIHGANLIFVGGELRGGEAASVRAAVESGRTAVVLVPTQGGDSLLGALLGTPTSTVTETVPASYAMFGEIDFRHPLFASLADPRYSDFTKIHVWRYRRLDPSAWPAARVVARFDSGDPAIIEVPTGKGRYLVFATGWQPGDSQLAVSSKFVPLMWSVLEMAGAAVTSAPPVFVGDVVPVPRDVTSVRQSDGTVVPVSNADRQFRGTTAPGVYQYIGGERPGRFVVNLDPSESRTTPLALDELERLGVPATTAAVAPTAPALAAARAVETENRQKLWRWLIGAAIVVVLAESALAGWTSRRAALAAQEGTT